MAKEGVPGAVREDPPADRVEEDVQLPPSHPDSLPYRLVVLFFTCLLTFGSYFCFDQPSALQDMMQDQLDIDNFQFNLLYSVYSFSNMIMVIFGGYFVDKLGTRPCTVLFVLLIFTGQVLFSLGTTLEYYPLALAGRIIFGTGGGSISVVQNSIVSHWFKGKELAFAFGVALTSSRLGSVLNFFFSSPLANATSLNFALWFGAGLCCLSMTAAACFVVLDLRASRITGRDPATSARKIRVQDIKELPLSFWLLSFICMFFYSVVFPFIADAPKFFVHKWGYSSDHASIIGGICYDVSLLLSPFLGMLVDRIGQRGILVLVASTMLIVPMQLFAGTTVNPIIGMVVLGTAYSLAAASLWPSVALVVPLRVVGTALGVMTSIQMLGVSMWNLVVGYTLDHAGYTMMTIVLMCTAMMAVVLSVALIYNDSRKGGVLSKANTGKTAKQEWEEEQRAAAGKEVQPNFYDEEESLIPAKAGAVN
eukprot:TRINITY_DN6262_c0_g1_i1.p1 TRINITY_DN6262_c0_g1~~TRINITY_DN6262_c0_g1_i1.p1  ORF type:complete len:478 (+),score=140.48 TRINITY_DN6262_c0_g1_i1:87-1520(+)